jgi:hypothetical protein
MLWTISALHPLSHGNVLCSTVTADPAGNSVSDDVLKEELEDGSSAIVEVGPDACHKT